MPVLWVFGDSGGRFAVPVTEILAVERTQYFCRKDGRGFSFAEVNNFMSIKIVLADGKANQPTRIIERDIRFHYVHMLQENLFTMRWFSGLIGYRQDGFLAVQKGKGKRGKRACGAKIHAISWHDEIKG